MFYGIALICLILKKRSEAFFVYKISRGTLVVGGYISILRHI